VGDSRRLSGRAVSTPAFPNSLWVTAQAGRNLLLRRATFSGWRFTNLFRVGMREHVAGFTLKNHADLLQRFKIDS
jgi:hypothetical protein